jgi:hypothetical protein
MARARKTPSLSDTTPTAPEVVPVAAAPVEEAPPPAPPPAMPATPQKYRVARAVRYIVDGTVHHVAAGSIVSATTHNVTSLQAQGAELETC